jgi:hypothetical protein
MSRERSSDLARQCTELIRKDNYFPTVWTTVPKRNVLVAGIPQQRHEHRRSLPDIPLITGENFVFDGDAKEFRAKEPSEINDSPGETD